MIDSDARLDELTGPIWDFLAAAEPPSDAEVIFAFGCNGDAVPAQAAALFAADRAPLVLATGGHGPMTGDQPLSEAETFAAAMIERGVPASRIVTEPTATNTGQNVSRGMAALAAVDADITSALLVAKPFLTRRALATFAKQFPEVRTVAAPPPGPASAFLDRPRDELARRLLGELDRLRSYPAQGFTVPVGIPHEVQRAEATLSAALADPAAD